MSENKQLTELTEIITIYTKGAHMEKVLINSLYQNWKGECETIAEKMGIDLDYAWTTYKESVKDELEHHFKS